MSYGDYPYPDHPSDLRKEYSNVEEPKYTIYVHLTTGLTHTYRDADYTDVRLAPTGIDITRTDGSSVAYYPNAVLWAETIKEN